MHPSIRILTCIAFIAFVSQSEGLLLFVFAGLLLVSAFILDRRYVISSGKMLWRLRWLFLSILILSFWFTPGEALFAVYADWSPTYEGIIFGLQRIVILAEIILAVNLLVLSIAMSDLIAALQWLFRPFNLIGVTSDRLALRIALTLQELRQPTIDVSALVSSTANNPPLKRAVDVVSKAYQLALQPESNEAQADPEIAVLQSPVLLQWLLFAVIIALLSLSQWVL
jgi:energy-coupling factor transport system permease protein